MNPSLVDNLIMIAIGAFITLARCSIVAEITDSKKKQLADRIFKIGGPVIVICGTLLALGNMSRTVVDLDRVVHEVNAVVPKRIDEATRLDRASAGPGRRLTYDLTLVSMKAQDVDRVAWKQKAVPSIRANMTQTKAVHTLLSAGVTVSSRYFSSDGVLIDEIVTSPEELLTK